MDRKNLISAGILLFTAVLLGAFGAHALKTSLSPGSLGQWRTGVEYQFYHGLGLLLVASLGERISTSVRGRIGWCFLLGVICFSGSLYLLSTRELTGWTWLGPIAGPITPLGGLLFMAGWAQLVFASWRKTDRG